MIFAFAALPIAAIYVYYLLLEEFFDECNRYKKRKEFDRKCEENLRNFHEKHGNNSNNLTM